MCVSRVALSTEIGWWFKFNSSDPSLVYIYIHLTFTKASKNIKLGLLLIPPVPGKHYFSEGSLFQREPTPSVSPCLFSTHSSSPRINPRVTRINMVLFCRNCYRGGKDYTRLSSQGCFLIPFCRRERDGPGICGGIEIKLIFWW